MGIMSEKNAKLDFNILKMIYKNMRLVFMRQLV